MNLAGTRSHTWDGPHADNVHLEPVNMINSPARLHDNTELGLET